MKPLQLFTCCKGFFTETSNIYLRQIRYDLYFSKSAKTLLHLLAPLVKLTYNSDYSRVITNTEERSEYILKVDGQEIHYIETVKIVDEDTQKIDTKVFNNETNELLQHFATVVEDDKIIEQEVIDFKDLSQQEDSIMFSHTNFAATNFTNSRFASVSVLGISLYALIFMD